MTDIVVSQISEVYNSIEAEPGIHAEIFDYFSFFADGFQYSPLYKIKKWDGRIHLYKKDKLLYSGLLKHLVEFAQKYNYKISIDKECILMNSFSLEEAKCYINTLNICSNNAPIVPRDYQIIGIAKAIRYKKMLLVSPTASGKSYIMYCITRYLLDNGLCQQGVIIVPTVNLVEQLYKDFEDYSTQNNWCVYKYTQKIYEGQSKIISKPIVISTWQSLHNIKKIGFFEQFDFVIGDEAHTFKARSLSAIMTKLSNAKYRIGTTGTLDNIKVNKLALEAYF